MCWTPGHTHAFGPGGRIQPGPRTATEIMEPAPGMSRQPVRGWSDWEPFEKRERSPRPPGASCSGRRWPASRAARLGAVGGQLPAREFGSGGGRHRGGPGGPRHQTRQKPAQPPAADHQYQFPPIPIRATLISFDASPSQPVTAMKDKTGGYRAPGRRNDDNGDDLHVFAFISEATTKASGACAQGGDHRKKRTRFDCQPASGRAATRLKVLASDAPIA